MRDTDDPDGAPEGPADRALGEPADGDAAGAGEGLGDRGEGPIAGGLERFTLAPRQPVGGEIRP